MEPKSLKNKLDRKAIALALWACCGAMLVATYVLVLVASRKIGGTNSDVAIGGLGSIIFGLLAWGQTKRLRESKLNRVAEFGKDSKAVSPVIAVVLMVAITVVLAVSVFVMVRQLDSQHNIPPVLGWMEEGSNLTVTSASQDLAWSDFAVSGCARIPTGTVEAGDIIQECAGRVTIRHIPSNTLVYDGEAE